jgi:hypothetical protein
MRVPKLFLSLDTVENTDCRNIFINENGLIVGVLNESCCNSTPTISHPLQHHRKPQKLGNVRHANNAANLPKSPAISKGLPSTQTQLNVIY